VSLYENRQYLTIYEDDDYMVWVDTVKGVMGYGRYGIYGTLTLLWEDRSGLPGTSFFQFGVTHDSQTQFQPFYDPDLKELTYLHRGPWIAAGWSISDLSLLQSAAKYFYYTLIGRAGE